MKRFFAFTLAIVAAIILTACGGKGSAASSPANVVATAGDTTAIVTWNMQPGVEYWVYSAQGTGITPQNCISMVYCRTAVNVTSPFVLSGLVNGVTYSVTIDSRVNKGPGGPGSASIQVTPALAGAIWSTGTSLGGNDLHGLAYGGLFAAVGDNGALFNSIDGNAWTAVANPAPYANLNAVIFYSGKYIAVGSGGVILASPDGVTWTQQNSGTTNDLYAITGNGLGGFVAVGANGTIINSTAGAIWTTVTSNTSSSLYGVTYGNSTFVAVGASGTLLTSTDGASWQAPSFLPAYDLKGVVYAAGSFVAVGDNGTLVTSPDGSNWVAQNQISSTLLTAVTYGHQFVAVDSAGNIYNSPDGVNWILVQTIPSALYAVLPAQYLAGQYLGGYVYSAVGGSGANILSQ